MRGSTLAAETGPWDAAQVLGACIFPSLSQTFSWARWRVGGPWVQARVSGRHGVHAGIWGTHKCAESVGRAECECCVCAANTKLDQPASRAPVRWVGGLGCGQGHWADRGTMPGESTNVHLHVNLESVVRAPALVACLCQPKGGGNDNDLAACACVYASPLWRCRSRQCLVCSSLCD